MLIRKNKEQGFSMLEVLVTLIIILLGVLGMAGMQMLAINNTQIARTNSLAAILTSSFVANMQTNAQYWSTYTRSGTATGVSQPGVSPVSGSTTVLSDSVLNGLTTNCVSSTCSQDQLAAYDLKNWGANVATLLPAATGTVSCNGATPNVCTVSVTWSEKNVALHNQAIQASSVALTTGTVQQQTYTTIASIN
jgi:type IV pilus assembly protein PilV